MSAVLSDTLEAHRALLWGVGYRMLGVAAEADDLVQDAFIRALEHPPQDTTRPLRPWLVTVAMNLARDRLRTRKRRGYVGPFLPSPVSDIRLAQVLEQSGHSPERRFMARESLAYTVLVALEALTERQRAVWVLRAGLGYSVKETAATLDMSAGNVKTTFHRARRIVQAAPEFDAGREAERRARELFVALIARDRKTVLKWLADDIAVFTDGGGQYSAATHIITGPENAATLLIGVQRFRGEIRDVAFERFGGLIGARFAQDYPDDASERLARRGVFLVGFDDAGRLARFYTVYADAKLAAASLVVAP